MTRRCRMETKSSMSLVRITPSTPSVDRVRTKYCFPDCSKSMDAIVTGEETCFRRLKTGRSQAGVAASVLSSAASPCIPRPSIAAPAELFTKLRRFIIREYTRLDAGLHLHRSTKHVSASVGAVVRLDYSVR